MINASVAIAEALVVIGGTLDDGISASVFAFDSSAKSWKTLPNLIKARACHRSVYAKDEHAIVVVGGSNEWPSAGFGECEILKMSPQDTLAWQRLPSLRSPRSCHGLCYHSGQVIACGGMMNPSRAKGFGIAQFDLTDSCELLDLKAERPQWQAFPSLNLARFGLQLLPLQLGAKRVLLAVGGRGPHPDAEYSVEVLDLDREMHKWTLLEVRLLAPRIDFAAAIARQPEQDSDQPTASILILGGNRVTEDPETDSSRTWETLQVSLSQGKIRAESVSGGRLPNSRVGCRASVLQQLVPGQQHLVVAGGFKAWGEGQNTYGGPLDQSVAIMEVGDRGNGPWIDFAKVDIAPELQNLPLKVHAPAVCTVGNQNDGEKESNGHMEC